MVNAVPGSLYIYAPTKGVSIAFAVLFLISGLLHIWQNIIKYRSWRIGFLFPWAAALFVVGFCMREYGAYHYGVLNIFIASQVMLFIAPPVYNGANYFVFGRTLYYLPYLSIIHPGRVWSTFITLDAVVGILAGNGASYLSNSKNTPSQRHMGATLVRVSLILLLGLNVAFTVLIVNFHYRVLGRANSKYGNLMTANLRVLIYTLYVSTFLIVLRNTFRTASAFYAYTSPVNTSEPLLFCLEFLPMLINTYLFNVFPPAKYLPANHKIYLAVDGRTEIQGPGMSDRRMFLLTVLDPFDVIGMLTGRDSKNRFWEKDGIGGPKVGAEGECAPKYGWKKSTKGGQWLGKHLQA
ncbi:hypothetical protein DV737_g5398, partial [Chaetothyriales sp. CBS 132003]